MKWDTVKKRIAKAEAEFNIKNGAPVQIEGDYYYNVLGQALCNKEGTGAPKGDGQKRSSKDVAEAYRTASAEEKPSFERFMVLLGGAYWDVPSLRVKIANINSKIKEAWEAKYGKDGVKKYGDPDPVQAKADIEAIQLRGLRIQNNRLEHYKKGVSADLQKDRKELDDFISTLL